MFQSEREVYLGIETVAGYPTRLANLPTSQFTSLSYPCLNFPKTSLVASERMTLVSTSSNPNASSWLSSQTPPRISRPLVPKHRSDLPHPAACRPSTS